MPPEENKSEVSREEFVNLQKETREGLDKIIDMLSTNKVVSLPIRHEQGSGPVGSAVEDAKALVEAASHDRGYLPAQYQRIFEKYFDPTDGFEARLNFPEIDERGRETGGITFTVVVPEKFSNTQEAYKKFYKNDLRTRALRPDGIAKGIDDWCRLVSRNLKYNRNAAMK